MQAAPNGEPAWAGLAALAPDADFDQARAINASIADFQAAGGDVMISLGGAFGTSLAQSFVASGRSATALAATYASIVDWYSLNRLDFDIEGAAVADPASIALRSEAIAILQQVRPDLEVWYTLPVLPAGLTADGLEVVRSALAAGVTLDGVNVMAMNYGSWAAPTTGPNARPMGEYAIAAAESTHAQLTELFGEYGQAYAWRMLGVTPMIGVNDLTAEVFTVADAQLLEDFAREKGLGMLSMWSVARDNPGDLGRATATASGLDVAAGSFSGVFTDYGTQNTLDLGGSDPAPQPADPVPTDPVPTDPVPTDPVEQGPVDPAPTDPARSRSPSPIRWCRRRPEARSSRPGRSRAGRPDPGRSWRSGGPADRCPRQGPGGLLPRVGHLRPQLPGGRRAGREPHAPDLLVPRSQELAARSPSTTPMRRSRSGLPPTRRSAARPTSGTTRRATRGPSRRSGATSPSSPSSRRSIRTSP